MKCKYNLTVRKKWVISINTVCFKSGVIFKLLVMELSN